MYLHSEVAVVAAVAVDSVPVAAAAVVMVVVVPVEEHTPLAAVLVALAASTWAAWKLG